VAKRDRIVFEWLREVWARTDLSYGAKGVAWCLADLAGEKGVAWPKVSTIVERIGAGSERPVRGHIAELRDGGWIVVEDMRHLRAGNRYRLARDEAPLVPPEPDDDGTPATPSTKGSDGAGSTCSDQQVESGGDMLDSASRATCSDQQVETGGRPAEISRGDLLKNVGATCSDQQVVIKNAHERPLNAIARAQARVITHASAGARESRPRKIDDDVRRGYGMAAEDVDRRRVAKLATMWADRYRTATKLVWMGPRDLAAICEGRSPSRSETGKRDALVEIAKWCAEQPDPDRTLDAIVKAAFDPTDAWMRERGYPITNVAKHPDRYAAHRDPVARAEPETQFVRRSANLRTRT
jgi:hypothetical protein